MPQTLTATVYARPRKIAFVISTNDDPGVRRWLVDYNCVIWGGLFNAIVPTDGEQLEDHWWRFLEWYDPDMVVHCIDLKPELVDELDHLLVPLNVLHWRRAGSIIPPTIDVPLA